MMPTPPILLIAFNRPDLTQKAIEKISEVKPKQLFFAADGPRRGKPSDGLACSETRRAIEQVDWDCDLFTLFREENVGCRANVSTAISWFFDHVREGVIMEDDCVPETSFFSFCSALLATYRDDERVMAVCGESYGPSGIWPADAAYQFTGIPLIWGWATWRRAWQLYDDDMSAFGNTIELDWLSKYHGSHQSGRYWESAFSRTLDGEFDSWGFRWILSVWANHGLCAMPRKNLVSNLGCDSRGTHTRDSTWAMANRVTQRLEPPFTPPQTVFRNLRLDAALLEERFGIPSTTVRSSRQIAHSMFSEAGELVSLSARRTRSIVNRLARKILSSAKGSSSS